MGMLPWRMTRFRRKICLSLTALALFVLVILKILSPAEQGSSFGIEGFPPGGPGDVDAEIQVMPETSMIKKIWKTKVASIFNRGAKEEKTFPNPNYNVHGFYYSWYGNPRFDGKYIHWNHPILRHWDPSVAKDFSEGVHEPPEDIGASFYPSLGAYSSRDPVVIEQHMQQLRTAAIGVLALSWYPPGLKDDNGEPTEEIVPLIMDIATKYQVKVAFHIEPYSGRDHKTMFENIKYIVDTYGTHPAFYRYKSSSGALLPLYYIYDSYLQRPEIWAELLKRTGEVSIRNTPYDGMFIGLLVEERHKSEIANAGFDGIYTYFASNGFSYGSTRQNWASIKAFCETSNLIFIPSVGPGYIDTSIRPWNSKNTRNRINGKYYESSLKAAVQTSPEIISVTSFNEWHEGSQIETAIPKIVDRTSYLDYLPHKPTVYLDITRRWAENFRKLQRKSL